MDRVLYRAGSREDPRIPSLLVRLNSNVLLIAPLLIYDNDYAGGGESQYHTSQYHPRSLRGVK